MSIPQHAHDGLDTWNRELRDACGYFDTELAFNRSLFIGEISNLPRGLAILRTNAGLIKRPAHHADHDNDQDCFLVSQRSGYSQIAQNGQTLQLAPGEVVGLFFDGIGDAQQDVRALLRGGP